MDNLSVPSFGLATFDFLVRTTLARLATTIPRVPEGVAMPGPGAASTSWLGFLCRIRAASRSGRTKMVQGTASIVCQFNRAIRLTTRFYFTAMSETGSSSSSLVMGAACELRRGRLFTRNRYW